MKRMISIILAVLLFFGLLPVGARAEGDETAAAEETAAPAAEEAPAYLVEPQTLGFVEFSLSKADLYRKIKVSNYYYEATEGKQFLFLSGQIRNTFNSSYSLGKIAGECLVDDTYSFSLNALMAEGGSLKTTVDPFGNGTFYLFAELPDELAESMTSAVIRFGFNENFEPKPEKASDGKYSYEITVSRDEGAEHPIDLHEFSPVKYKLKTELKAKSVKLTFTKKIASNKAKIDSGRGYPYQYQAAKGTKYIGLAGTISNTGKTELEPNISGYVLVDGVKYRMDLYSLGSGYNIPPKGKIPVFLHAEIPNSALKNQTSVKIYFGFDDELTNGYNSVPEDCQYAYVYTLKLE